jgi:hypothetical protein
MKLRVDINRRRRTMPSEICGVHMNPIIVTGALAIHRPPPHLLLIQMQRLFIVCDVYVVPV